MPAVSVALATCDGERFLPDLLDSLTRQTLKRPRRARSVGDTIDLVREPPAGDLSVQAVGCPIVASELPGIAEVARDGVDGLLFPPGDTGALAILIEALCGDRQRVTRLADNVSAPKSIGSYVDDIEATYIRLSGEGGNTV